MLSSIQKMLQAFEDNGILYCHWKSNEHLAAALDGDTDLDILFEPTQRSLLEYILNSCELKRFRAVPAMQYNAIEDYIGYDNIERKIWHLHLHYRMTFGEKHLKAYTLTPWTQYILNRRIQNELGIFTSTPEIELTLLIVRMALKLRWRDRGRKISKDDSVEYQWLLERTNQASIRAAATDLVGGECSTLIIKVCDGTLQYKNQLLKIQKKLRKELKVFTGYSKISSWGIRTRRELSWLIGGAGRRLNLNHNRPYRRISPSGGCVIALLGCDGAGKTTTLDYIRQEFAKKIDVKIMYLGSGDGSSSLLRKPMKFFAKKVGGKGVGSSIEKQNSINKRVSLKAHLYATAKIIWATALAREKKNKLRQITKSRNAGMLVLIDRYPQTAVKGFNDGPLLAKYRDRHGVLRRISLWEDRIYESFSINPPDLLIKLMISTDIAIQRKPEMTIEEIEQKKNAIRQMHFAKEIEIDTSQEITTTLSEAMSEIWKLI